MARRWWGACITLLLLTLTPYARADYLVASRSATLKGAPASDGPTLDRVSRGDVLALLEEAQTDGYYHAQPAGRNAGWIYRTLVRRFPGSPAGGGAPSPLLEPLGMGEMRAHFIDVGQGQATLLEFQCGAVLIDTGGEKNADFDSTDRLLAYLESFFSTRSDLNNTLDLVVLSHPHIDHTRGVSEVLDRFTVKNAIDNGQTVGSGGPQQALLQDYAQHDSDVGYEAVRLSAISRTDGRTSAVIDPIQCSDGDPKIRVLWGQVGTNPGWAGSEFENPNNHSVVVRVDYGAASFLIPGDLEEEAQADLVRRYSGTTLLDVDVYEAGHHGSRNGTSEDLVSAMTPEMAVISVGSASRKLSWTAWKYGHPNTTVLRKLSGHVTETRTAIRVPVGSKAMTFANEDVTRAIYATAWDGTVIMAATLDGAISVTTTNPRVIATGNP